MHLEKGKHTFLLLFLDLGCIVDGAPEIGGIRSGCSWAASLHTYSWHSSDLDF